MKISSTPDTGVSVRDLPPGLAGVHGTDVMLPNGQSVYLQGASRDAHVLLQDEIDSIVQQMPVALPTAVLLKIAADQYCRRLMEMVKSAA